MAAVKIWRSEQRATNFGHRNRVEEATPIAKLSCKSFSDNLIFFTEKYSSGDVCERCRWQSKRAIRSGSRRRAQANCLYEVRCGNGNRVEEATPIAKLSCKSFSDNLIFFTEKYSSGRRGVTRKQTDLVTVYFLGPLQHLAFTELKRRESKRLVCSFLSKFRQHNIMEKYSSGHVCERCRWQSKRAIRSGSRRRARANCICEVRCGNGNRIEEATPIAKLSCKSFSDNLIFFMEKYSSGRRGVTRNLVGR